MPQERFNRKWKKQRRACAGHSGASPSRGRLYPVSAAGLMSYVENRLRVAARDQALHEWVDVEVIDSAVAIDVVMASADGVIYACALCESPPSRSRAAQNASAAAFSPRAFAARMPRSKTGPVIWNPNADYHDRRPEDRNPRRHPRAARRPRSRPRCAALLLSPRPDHRRELPPLPDAAENAR